MKAKDIATPCRRLSQDDLASKARAEFRKNKTRAMPVFSSKELVGVITRSDLIKITSTKSNITVKDLLWKPLVKIDASDPITKTARTLVENGIKQAPVFENNKFIGMARDLDLLKALVSSKRPNRKKVADVMTPGATTFSTKDRVSKVWLIAHGHSGFPVLDKREVVGIISSQELLESKRARISRETEKQKTVAKVEHVMRIITGEEARFLVKPSDTIQDAVAKIIDTKAGILPVVDNGLIGVVSRRDLLRGYI